MSATMPVMPTEIAYDYDNNGEVRCANPRGLTFFLFSEPVLAAKPPAPQAPLTAAWQQVAATMEVEVRRETEPKTLAELSRTVPKAETPTVQAAPAPQAVRGTSPLTAAQAPGKEPAKGWFNKLFKG